MRITEHLGLNVPDNMETDVFDGNLYIKDNFETIDYEMKLASEQLADTATKLVYVQQEKRQVAETDDTARIQRAIAKLTSGDTLILAGNYTVSAKLADFTFPLKIQADLAKITVTAPIANLFTTTSKLVIDGADIDGQGNITDCLFKHRNDFPSVQNCIFRNIAKITLTETTNTITSKDSHAIIKNNKHFNVREAYLFYGSNISGHKGDVSILDNYFDEQCGRAYYVGYANIVSIRDNKFNADPALQAAVNCVDVQEVYDIGNTYKNYYRSSTIGYLTKKIRVMGNLYQNISLYAVSLDTSAGQIDANTLATFPFSVIADFDASLGIEPASANNNQAVRVIKGGVVNGRTLKVNDLLVYNSTIKTNGYNWYPDVDSTDTIIANNTFINCSDLAIRLQASDVLIEGNIFDNACGDNKEIIRANASVRIKVKGNQIYHTKNTSVFVRATLGSQVDIDDDNTFVYDNPNIASYSPMFAVGDIYSKVKYSSENIQYITNPTAGSNVYLLGSTKKVIIDTNTSFTLRLPAESLDSDFYHEIEIVRVDSNQSAEVSLSTNAGYGAINGGSATTLYCNQIMKVTRNGIDTKYKAFAYDIQTLKKGGSAYRPTNSSVRVGYEYFDTTLGKPVWNKGSVWVDATGTTV